MELKTSDLYKKHNKLVLLKKNAYDDIFRKCLATIKMTATTGQLWCIYEIPSFSISAGYPIVNNEYCAEYVIEKMSQQSKHVKSHFIEPGLLFFDWRKIT
jgi:hypothetical protein